MFCAAGAVFLIGWLLTALRRGPVSAFVAAGQVAGDCALDLVRMSPRRVGALAWLAVKESIRRRMVVVLAVFVIILLFAGWYLDPSSTNPARLYLDFVFDDATLLPLALAGAVPQLVEPAGRHQEPHAAHGRDQARAGQ